jgi:hypothetical protein
VVVVVAEVVVVVVVFEVVVLVVVVVVVETGVAVVWLTVVVVATGVDVVLLKSALIQHLTILYQPRIGGTYVGPVVVVVPVVVPLGRLPYTNCEPSNNGMLETR